MKKGSFQYWLKEGYWNHVAQAKRRGIKHCFSYEEWITWWEINLGPRWFTKRGRKAEHYCMARYGDKGPYNNGNVKCITNSENIRERKSLKGTKNPASKLTSKQALAIYISNERSGSLAKQYNISREVVWLIRTRRAWTHLTQHIR